MFEMLRKMEPPLGFGKNCPARLAYKRLIQMNMPVTNEKCVHFSTTLMALIRTSLEIKMISKEDSCYATYRDQKHLDGELRKEIQIAWPNLDQKQLDELITPQDSHPKVSYSAKSRTRPNGPNLQSSELIKYFLTLNTVVNLELSPTSSKSETTSHNTWHVLDPEDLSHFDHFEFSVILLISTY